LKAMSANSLRCDLDHNALGESSGV
jgi:hypothetical protein